MSFSAIIHDDSFFSSTLMKLFKIVGYDFHIDTFFSWSFRVEPVISFSFWGLDLIFFYLVTNKIDFFFNAYLSSMIRLFRF